MSDPTWYVIIQSAASVATTGGVLTALYVAVVREPRKAGEEHKRHEAEMEALKRAELDRIAAQARKVVPSCLRTPMFGNNWWTVKIENISNAVATTLAVDVAAIDTNGNVVRGGCPQSNNTMPVDQTFRQGNPRGHVGLAAGRISRSGSKRLHAVRCLSNDGQPDCASS